MTIVCHARFKVSDRKKKDVLVLECFGKGKERPISSITICTQVCEQSLDISFDYIITELCPIDLLIQRLGRMLRFPHPVPGWVNVEAPEFTVLYGEYGKSKYVYAEYFLDNTLNYLRKHQELLIPDNMRAAIEYVYKEDPLNKKFAEIMFMDQQKKSESMNVVKPVPNPNSYYLYEMANTPSLFGDDLSDMNGEQLMSTRYTNNISARLILGDRQEYTEYCDRLQKKDSKRLNELEKKMFQNVVSFPLKANEKIVEDDMVHYIEKGKLAGCWYLICEENDKYRLGDIELDYGFEYGLRRISK